MSLRKDLTQPTATPEEEVMEQLSVLTFSESKKEEEISPDQFHAVPKQVKQAELHPNGKLLSDDEIEQLKLRYQKSGDYLHRVKLGVSNANRVQCNFPIAFTENGIIASIKKPTLFGKGKFGEVKIQQNQLTGHWGATKVIKTEDLSRSSEKQCLDSAIMELEISLAMGQAQSSTLIQRKSKTGHLKCQFFMEAAEGEELYDLLEKDMLPKDSKKLLIIALNFLQQVMLLHKEYVHCDIKDKNIFVDILTGKVTLLDFGFGLKKDKNGNAKGYYHTGTPSTMAPEIINNETNIYSAQTDTYSVSVVLFALLFGRRQRFAREQRYWEYHKDCHSNLDNNVIEINNKHNGKTEYTLSKEIRDILQRGCSEDPKHRATLTEIARTLQKHLSLLEAPSTHLAFSKK